MNIVIFGAGAIGSLFGVLLSTKHTVTCVARKNHVQTVNKNGLTIHGKTKLKKHLSFVETMDQIEGNPELIILTVKSFDTSIAAQQIQPYISGKNIILSLQNGLTNIDDLIKYIPKQQIIAGITSWGAVFKKPGFIEHTGTGDMTLGELNGEITDRLQKITEIFNGVGVASRISENIRMDIWKKAIVNSSVNPITAILQIKNGYLLKNPILTTLVEMVCIESTTIANAMGLNLNKNHMIELTKKVINDTKHNESSMLQSIKSHKKTEIDSINGYISLSGKKAGCDYFLNEMMVEIIQSF